MSVKCEEIIKIMEAFAPVNLAESWDNPGLLCGSRNSEVKKIMLALDASEEVIDEAVEKNADMIITHHPLIFRPVKKINDDSVLGKKIIKLIKNDISLYACHTNLDAAFGGTNDVLADLAGLREIEVLSEDYIENYYKIVVFVPDEYEKKIKDALFESGAGSIGCYSEVSFTLAGKSEFKPEIGAEPFIGEIGRPETVKEVRIETIIPKKYVKQAVDAVVNAHPYEEPVYDIYELKNDGEKFGIGRIGTLGEETSFRDFSLKLKESLGLNTMRIAGSLDKRIKRVALCTGSGFEYCDKARALGADVYITSDLKYHEMQSASEGMCLIDATHFASENIVVPVLCSYLIKKTAEAGLNLEIIRSERSKNSFMDI